MLRCFCCRSAPVKAHYRKSRNAATQEHQLILGCFISHRSHTSGPGPRQADNKKDSFLAVDTQVWCRMSHVHPFSNCCDHWYAQRMWCSCRQCVCDQSGFVFFTVCVAVWSPLAVDWVDDDPVGGCYHRKAAINSVISQVNGSMMLGTR